MRGPPVPPPTSSSSSSSSTALVFCCSRSFSRTYSRVPVPQAANFKCCEEATTFFERAHGTRAHKDVADVLLNMGAVRACTCSLAHAS
mmetsp:Transcript_2776/g.6584  ORF Transcript_2776/g.6584 Transcript_2776/m.6584 type:complete len:88 (-) Transcript_2776:11-274(-)